MRMADPIAELRPSSAHFTYFRHSRIAPWGYNPVYQHRNCPRNRSDILTKYLERFQPYSFPRRRGLGLRAQHGRPRRAAVALRRARSGRARSLPAVRRTDHRVFWRAHARALIRHNRSDHTLADSVYFLGRQRAVRCANCQAKRHALAIRRKWRARILAEKFDPHQIVPGRSAELPFDIYRRLSQAGHDGKIERAYRKAAPRLVTRDVLKPQLFHLDQIKIENRGAAVDSKRRVQLKQASDIFAPPRNDRGSLGMLERPGFRQTRFGSLHQTFRQALQLEQ